MLSANLYQESHRRIQQGSKSFYFASWFLSSKFRLHAWLLYLWCRESDDLIDEAPSHELALTNLEQLNTQLHQIFDKTDQSQLSTDFKTQALMALKLEINFDASPLHDLLRGYKMDLDGYYLKSQSQLLDYCYCVAGTVGIMMCQIMQIKSSQALTHAKDLGIAMQLTNIIRDFDIDLKLNRLYIPLEFFNSHSLSPDMTVTNRIAIFKQAALYLFNLAETYYQSGLKGLRYLPFRERLAIATAASVYRRIGLMVLKKQEQAWSHKTYTHWGQKLFSLGQGFYWSLGGKL